MAGIGSAPRSSVSDDYLQIVSGLAFIAKVRINEKISIPSRGEPYVSRDTLWTSLYRRIFGESRQETLTYLKETFARTTEIAREIAAAGDETRLASLRDLADGAKAGVDNLCRTYGDDKFFSSQIACIYEDFMFCLQDITFDRVV